MTQRRLFWCFTAIVLFHIGSLYAPPIYDESLPYLIAKFGRMTTWIRILPNPHDNGIGLFGVYGLWPGYIGAIRLGLKLFGDNLLALRLPGLLMQLGWMAALLLWNTRYDRGAWATAGLLVYSLTYFFLLNSHHARMEPFLVAVMVAHLYWIAFYVHNRWTAYGCGVAATAACCFHSLGFYFLPTYLALILMGPHTANEKARRLAWWVAGGMTGAWLALWKIDFNTGFLAFEIHRHTPFVSAIPLKTFGFNLIYLADNAMAYWRLGFKTNPLGNMMLAVLLALSVHVLRHSGKKFPKPVALVAWMLFGFAVTMALFNPKDIEMFYNAYLYPWMWMLSLTALGSLWDGRTTMDRHDAAIFCLFLFFAIPAKPPYGIVHLSLAWILLCWGWSSMPKTKSGFCFAVIGILFVMVMAPDYLLQLALGGMIFFKLHPAIFLSMAALPVLYLWKPFEVPPRTTAMLGGIVILLFMAGEVPRIKKAIVSARETAETAQLKLEIANKVRMVAPDMFWLLRPQADFASADALAESESYGGEHLSIKERLMAFKPDVIFWPKKTETMLTRSGAKLLKRKEWLFQNRYIEEYELLSQQ